MKEEHISLYDIRKEQGILTFPKTKSIMTLFSMND